VQDLADEYKSILNELNGDIGRATAIFTALHPDELVYNAKGKVKDFAPTASAFETAGSKSTSGATLPDTTGALRWMEQNAGFINDYKNVAAYFLPMEADTGQFNYGAYQMSLANGLRQRKTPQEFMNDVYVRNAEQTYFPTVKIFDAQIAQAKANGDTTGESQWKDEKKQWENEFYQLNPLFHQKIQSYADARSAALGQLQNLRQMVADGRVPNGLQGELAMLIANYDGLVQYTTLSGPKTAAEKSAAFQMFNQWAESHIANTPLADLYNGVFRVLDTNLTKL
jgi:hypothetical protein